LPTARLRNSRRLPHTHIHHEAASEVRRAIKKIGGNLPENLPAEPSIRILSRQKKAKQISNQDTTGNFAAA
jgi:hypothetical protein